MTSDINKIIEGRDLNDVIRSLQVNLGYSSTTYLPTIDEFIEKDFYLGKTTENGKNVYPYWREKLREFFPNPLMTNFDTLFFRDAIGSGKSTVARICILYAMMKVIEMEDPHKFFGLMKGKDIIVFLYSMSTNTINSAMYAPLLNILDESDYFKSRLDPTSKIRKYKNGVRIETGSTISRNVGKDIIIYWMDEIQREIRIGSNLENYNSLRARRKSRFMIDGGKFFNSLAILSGSPGSAKSFSEQMTKKNESNDRVFISQAPQWEVLKHKLNLSGRTFKLFIGDENNDPKVILDPSELVIYQNMIEDQSNIIDVPVEYLSEFQDDILIAIQDIAGKLTRSSTSFITNIGKLKDSFVIPKRFFNLEILKVPFFDSTQIQDLFLKDGKSVKEKLLNPNKPRFIHIDIGITGDLAGLAMSHIAEFVESKRIDPVTKKYTVTNDPVFINDFSIGISRYANEETAIFKIRDFIIYLKNNGVNIKLVTADGFQSAQILQELNYNGIKAEKLSVKGNQFIVFRTALYSNRVLLQKSDQVEKEFSNFERSIRNGKTYISHPSTSQSGSHGDIAESIVGSIYSADKHKDSMRNPLRGISSEFRTGNIITDENDDFDIMFSNL